MSNVCRAAVRLALLCMAVESVSARGDEGPYAPGSSSDLVVSHYSPDVGYPDGLRPYDVREYCLARCESLTHAVALALQGVCGALIVADDPVVSLLTYSGQFPGAMVGYETIAGDYFKFSGELR